MVVDTAFAPANSVTVEDTESRAGAEDETEYSPGGRAANLTDPPVETADLDKPVPTFVTDTVALLMSAPEAVCTEAVKSAVVSCVNDIDAKLMANAIKRNFKYFTIDTPNICKKRNSTLNCWIIVNFLGPKTKKGDVNRLFFFVILIKSSLIVVNT